mmetsp:Transcript_11410/g.22390  ORF Transcript_11410/g.22390 Transcript_11410/m.22390 type:complete len:345 (+) Transcript_11410:245-1279(+)
MHPVKAAHDIVTHGARPKSTKQSLKPKAIQSGFFESKPKSAQDDSVVDKKRKSKLLLGQLEDDDLQEDDIIYENFYATRPPARQKERAMYLGDSSEAEFAEKRPINISTEQRPPSRHKTPPKAIGLDLPPSSKKEHYVEVDKMYSSNSLNGSFDDIDLSEAENPLVRTMPIPSEPKRSESSKSAPRKRKSSKEKPKSRSSSKPRGKLGQLLEAWEKSAESKRSSETAPTESNSVRTTKPSELKGENLSKARVVSSQKPLFNIPIVLNKQKYKTNTSQTSKPSEVGKEDDSARIEKHEITGHELNHHKRKDFKRPLYSANKTLPFKSSLDAEFLSLFSCDQAPFH